MSLDCIRIITAHTDSIGVDQRLTWESREGDCCVSQLIDQTMAEFFETKLIEMWGEKVLITRNPLVPPPQFRVRIVNCTKVSQVIQKILGGTKEEERENLA